MRAWLLSIAFCFASVGISACDSSVLTDLESHDTILVKLGPPDMDRRQFSFRIETERNYGCDAELTGRLVRGKAFMVMEMYGVIPGPAGCSWQPAVSQTETVRFTEQRSFDLEIRYKKETDLYNLSISDSSWVVTKNRNHLESELILLE